MKEIKKTENMTTEDIERRASKVIKREFARCRENLDRTTGPERLITGQSIYYKLPIKKD